MNYRLQNYLQGKTLPIFAMFFFLVCLVFPPLSCFRSYFVKIHAWIFTCIDKTLKLNLKKLWGLSMRLNFSFVCPSSAENPLLLFVVWFVCVILFYFISYFDWRCYAFSGCNTCKIFREYLEGLSNRVCSANVSAIFSLSSSASPALEVYWCGSFSRNS